MNFGSFFIITRARRTGLACFAESESFFRKNPKLAKIPDRTATSSLCFRVGSFGTSNFVL